jgi:hypothetical protein
MDVAGSEQVPAFKILTRLPGTGAPTGAVELVVEESVLTQPVRLQTANQQVARSFVLACFTIHVFFMLIIFNYSSYYE